MASKPTPSSSLNQQQPRQPRVLLEVASHQRLLSSRSHTTFGQYDDDDEFSARPLLRRGRSLSSNLRRLFRRLSSNNLSRTLRVPPFEAGSDTSFGVASGSSHASSSHLSGLWSPSLTGSEASSTSSLLFPLHPEFELELEIALEMAPHQLGSAWSHDSYNAMQYLRARTPYPPTMTDTVFDYHTQSDTSSKHTDRWQSALEIGCGPGQMSIHLATRFARVYGQDPSPNMLKLANTVKQMPEEELAEVHLPAVRDATRIEFAQARGEDPTLPPGEKVDLIMMAACIHWLDWERPEANWTKWASLLKPGGTLVVTGGRPVIGPYTGEKGDQIRPLRDWLLDFPLNYPEIDRYYGTSKMIQDLRSGGLYRKLPMPWDHNSELEALWDRESYCWIPIDDCTVLGEQATSSHLSKVDDPERFASMINNLPEWIRPGVRRATKCDNSHGDLIVSMTTPRKMADWVRSTSGYLKFMQDNAEQRKLSLQDQDFAAVELKKVCEAIGIDFDAEIQCHHSGAVLAIRRTDVECP
ncbi:putative S-adenosylmethionine-dependent methyltransferase CRG1 [Pseudozyma hubeiensis]|nr:putative S-adenosylmethionine-dependent methyltransferase CRG1 [Pseudozyma hubeiensis]